MGKGSMREVMPGAAALVDELRRMLGADLVDAALRTGVQLQRGAEAVRAEHGDAAAMAWLAAQRPAGASIKVREGYRVVGALPGRPAAGIARTRRVR